MLNILKLSYKKNNTQCYIKIKYSIGLNMFYLIKGAARLNDCTEIIS